MFKIIIFLLIAGGTLLNAQQIADTTFHFPIQQPQYKMGTGPVIFIDEAHHNFHTLAGRYAPFANFLQQDGYRTQSATEKFTDTFLSKKKILVIANAMDTTDWRLPTNVVFTSSEVESLKNWVNAGGSLLLIADHMPFPGHAENVGAAFGFNFLNGFALGNGGNDSFSRSKGNLNDCLITNGKDKNEKVDSLLAFTGQGFIAPSNATIITSFTNEYRIYFPEIAWQISDSTASIPAIGLAHAAYLPFGNGRIVVVGEAAMFTAQLAGPQRIKVGMNHPRAVQNPQFLLNIIHWLDRKL